MDPENAPGVPRTVLKDRNHRDPYLSLSCCALAHDGSGAKGYVGELGVPWNDPNEAGYLTMLDDALTYMRQNGVAATEWAYGYDEPAGSNPWWMSTQANLTIGLNTRPDGSTAPQWAVLKKYF